MPKLTTRYGLQPAHRQKKDVGFKAARGCEGVGSQCFDLTLKRCADYELFAACRAHKVVREFQHVPCMERRVSATAVSGLITFNDR